MLNKEELFNKLNDEMAFHDPHKWVLDIEIEDIPEVIEELVEEMRNLEESINEYDGDPGLFIEFEKNASESITYKSECIDILTNILEDDSKCLERLEIEKEQELIKNEEILNFRIANNFLEDGEEY